jgi:hypothetical protein
MTLGRRRVTTSMPIKTRFVKVLRGRKRQFAVRAARGERGIWQRRFWEHPIDYERRLRASLT